MIYIGNHVSVTKGYLAMGRKAKELGGDTFAFFTSPPRGGSGKDPAEEDLRALGEFLREEGFGPLVAHAPYTMNLCSAKEEVRSISEELFQRGLQKLGRLKAYTDLPLYLNFHPGAHLGAGYEAGRDLIASCLNRLLSEKEGPIVLLETMAGKGTEVGGSFEELLGIYERVENQDRVGICLDTCHVWDAGYDVAGDLEGVLEEFDHVLGLPLLRALHLNDSMNPLGARKDRHAKLGEGYIGKDALKRIISHPLLQGRPFILETPNEDEGYRKEIQFVRDCMDPDRSA